MGSIVVKLPLPPGCLPTLWKQDERMKESYLIRIPRLLQDRRRRLRRRGRLSLHHGPHRRHHQCRRTSPLDRRHGGSAGLASRCRRMRGDRRQGRVEGRAALRLRGAEIGRRPARRSTSRRSWSSWCATRSARWRPSRSRSPSTGLPKTRSGKILRGTMKKIADHDPWTMPATIDDPAIMDEIMAALRSKGF